MRRDISNWEKLLVPHAWDLSEEAIAAFENSEIGDTLRIDEPLVPLLFEDEENEGGYCIFAFTSEERVPAEYIQEEYAIAGCGLQYILTAMKAVEIILGRAPILVINPFDDENQEFTKEQVEAFVRESLL